MEEMEIKNQDGMGNFLLFYKCKVNINHVGRGNNGTFNRSIACINNKSFSGI